MRELIETTRRRIGVKLFLSGLLCLALLSGCGRKQSSHQSELSVEHGEGCSCNHSTSSSHDTDSNAINRYSDWNNETIAKYVEKANKGDQESANALFQYYRHYDGGNDQREALHWINEMRKHLISLPPNESIDTVLSKIDRQIRNQEAIIANLEMTAEELGPHIKLAKENDFKSILLLCNYYEYNHQYEQAIEWLNIARESTDQRYQKADPTEIMRLSNVPEKQYDEQEAEVLVEKLRRESSEYFTKRIKNCEQRMKKRDESVECSLKEDQYGPGGNG
jgi:hypothetical protein